MGRVGLERGEEDGVCAEGVNVVEALGDAVQTATAGGVEVGGVHLVDDGSLPPEIGCHARSRPAGSREGLGLSEGNCRGQSAGEIEGEECSMEVDHAFVIEMLPEKPRLRIAAYGTGYEGSIVAWICSFLVFGDARFYGQ